MSLYADGASSRIASARRQSNQTPFIIRQTGGSGNYGHCWLHIEPNGPGKGYEFINDIKGDVVPKEYIKPIEQGIQGAMELGILAGLQMVDIKVTLFDGSYHEVDSNEMAFKFAGSIAFKEAAKKANPVLLEPMMSIEIDVPEELATATRHEVYAHRGRIESNVTASGFSEIRAVVPLSELLVSSSGIAVCPREFVGYEVVRDRGSSDENGSGVTANKPNGPRPHRRSETSRLGPEDD
jgi:translation elongation factor EF-G